jgi:hypothetical protein
MEQYAILTIVLIIIFLMFLYLKILISRTKRIFRKYNLDAKKTMFLQGNLILTIKDNKTYLYKIIKKDESLKLIDEVVKWEVIKKEKLKGLYTPGTRFGRNLNIALAGSTTTTKYDTEYNIIFYLKNNETFELKINKFIANQLNKLKKIKLGII